MSTSNKTNWETKFAKLLRMSLAKGFLYIIQGVFTPVISIRYLHLYDLLISDLKRPNRVNYPVALNLMK